MPNVRDSSGTIGTMCLPIFLSRSRSVSRRTKPIVVDISLPSPLLTSLSRASSRTRRASGTLHRCGASRCATGHRTAQRLAALAQVLHLRAVFGRPVERCLGHLLVGDRDAEPRAELAQLLLVELLLVVGDVAAFAPFAQAVALDRLGEDDGRLAVLLHGARGRRRRPCRGRARRGASCSSFSSEKFFDQLQQLGVLAEEMLADVARRRRPTYFWYWPSTTSIIRCGEQAVVVGLDQRVPVAAPDHLDDVPAGAAERPFEFLDDLAVAAHRAVEPLQVAVDDEDQIVELLARGQRDGAERLGLVALAVAQEGPDALVATSP